MSALVLSALVVVIVSLAVGLALLVPAAVGLTWKRLRGRRRS